MDLYSRAMKKIASPDNGRKKSGRKQGALDDISVAGIRTRKDEPSTETVARLAYESVADTDPSKVTREKLGQAVHGCTASVSVPCTAHCAPVSRAHP
jgi:hypothetical protein